MIFYIKALGQIPLQCLGQELQRKDDIMKFKNFFLFLLYNRIRQPIVKLGSRLSLRLVTIGYDWWQLVFKLIIGFDDTHMHVYTHGWSKVHSCWPSTPTVESNIVSFFIFSQSWQFVKLVLCTSEFYKMDVLISKDLNQEWDWFNYTLCSLRVRWHFY